MKKIFFLIVLFLVSFFISLTIIDYGSTDNQVSEKLSFKPVVIIDAGHGGFDGGASAKDGTDEKGINLNIALYLKDYLEFFGFNVVMTRDTDTSTEDEGLTTIRSKKTSDLHNRMKIMDETENAIFVSIHQNFFPEEQYHGAQVFYSQNHSELSSVLAQDIQENIVYYLQPENKRQIKPCGTSVYLIYNAVKPAVLVECGFLSNYNEAELLKTCEYQKKMANSIAMGILEFYGGQ
ncbi:MAG: N-acetylmuramoyl-L-alanine amidase [Clostridia bacterium]|nr:N-acetylmuramoyl-L-alanine amidase [Clostridia bacterium]